jgi:hypothetical protein
MRIRKPVMSHLDFLRIFRSDRQKIRVGSDADGGYVIADGIDKYDAIVSCGVANDVNFENEMCRRCPNIPCFAYDGTVIGLPANADRDRITFVRKNIAYYESYETTNLFDIFEEYDNILLKMDIETFEFRWLQVLSPAQLKKIAQLVIEFHFPFNEPGFTNLDAPLPVYQKVDVLKKLADTHTLIHLHPNNMGGTYKYGGVTVPNLFECTYVRRDLQPAGELSREKIPSAELDRKNVGGIEEICLEGYPFTR